MNSHFAKHDISPAPRTRTTRTAPPPPIPSSPSPKYSQCLQRLHCSSAVQRYNHMLGSSHDRSVGRSVVRLAWTAQSSSSTYSLTGSLSPVPLYSCPRCRTLFQRLPGGGAQSSCHIWNRILLLYCFSTPNWHIIDCYLFASKQSRPNQ